MDNATCSVDGCARPLRLIKRRLCNTHYQADLRAKGKGRTKYVVECAGCGKEFGSTRPDGKLCSDECRAKHYAEVGMIDHAGPSLRRICKLPVEHPVRVLIRSNMEAKWRQKSALRLAVEAVDHSAIIEAVRRDTKPSDSGCWVWQRSLTRDGYPVVRLGKGNTTQVHRLVLEAKHGAPLGKQAAHHACANTHCVNPDHLQPVTARENTAEMLARTYMESRIADLEAALQIHEPDHPLLQEIGVVKAS